jgi:ribokinase
VLGERIVPHGDDSLPWERLGEASAVYFTGGDAGSLRAARASRVLVATPRAREAIAAAGIVLDALVRSGDDAGEGYRAGEFEPPPRLVVTTQGERGGRWESANGAAGTFAAAPLPGPPADAYGAGDSFAAGLTYALGSGMEVQPAVELAARCAAASLAGRGPYGSPLPRGG